MRFGLFDFLMRRDGPRGIAGLLDDATAIVQPPAQPGFAGFAAHHFTHFSPGPWLDEACPEACREPGMIGDPNHAVRRVRMEIRTLHPVDHGYLFPCGDMPVAHSQRSLERCVPKSCRCESASGRRTALARSRFRRRHASVPPDRGAFIPRAAGNPRRDNQSRHI